MRVGVAAQLHALAHPPVGAETVDAEGERVEARTLSRVGWLVVVPAAVERGIAVVVNDGGEHAREREHRIGYEAARHAAVHRPVERPHPHVDAREPSQGVGEAGRPHLPIARVGEEQDIAAQPADVLVEERGQPRRADLLLALREHLHVARQLALCVEPGPHRREVRDHARLVVGGAAPVQAAVRLPRFERVAAPPVDVTGGLHVVVRVEQDGGRAGVGL